MTQQFEVFQVEMIYLFFLFNVHFPCSTIALMTYDLIVIIKLSLGSEKMKTINNIETSNEILFKQKLCKH